MKLGLYISLVFLALFAGPVNSDARIFSSGEDTVGNHPEWYKDANNNGQYDTGEDFADTNKNGKWDADSIPNIKDMTYSATWDSNFPIAVCLYDRTKSFNNPDLIVNKFFVSDSAKVIFGIDNPASCPMPGSKIFVNYNNAIAGEFLISGVICVVNTIIFDAMFKVYCTVILWFYNILYAMIIIYVMFYGMAIMLGIGDNPIREAPKRILKVVLILFFAVNAQFGFRFIHNGFIGALNGFSDMLTDIQPYHDQFGQPAYQKSYLSTLVNSLTMNILDGPGKLLNENGEVWKPVKKGSAVSDKTTVDNIPGGLGTVDPQDYIPFRLPVQQWTYQKTKDGVDADNDKNTPAVKAEYKIFPVFLEAPMLVIWIIKSFV